MSMDEVFSGWNLASDSCAGFPISLDRILKTGLSESSVSVVFLLPILISHGIEFLMTADEVAAVIAARMPEAGPIRVEGDDGVHFSALVVSPTFNGLRPVQRHQRVYGALQGLVGGVIHALALETLTPEEWAARESAH